MWDSTQIISKLDRGLIRRSSFKSFERDIKTQLHLKYRRACKCSQLKVKGNNQLVNNQRAKSIVKEKV